MMYKQTVSGHKSLSGFSLVWWSVRTVLIRKQICLSILIAFFQVGIKTIRNYLIYQYLSNHMGVWLRRSGKSEVSAEVFSDIFIIIGICGQLAMKDRQTLFHTCNPGESNFIIDNTEKDSIEGVLHNHKL